MPFRYIAIDYGGSELLKVTNKNIFLGKLITIDTYLDTNKE